MQCADVLIVGAGPAGMAAAAELARQGLSALLIEQRDQMGGAIYRRFAGTGVSPVQLSSHHRQNFDVLMQGLTQAGSRVQPMMQSVLIGVDRDGRFLIDNRLLGSVIGLRPKAVILALGAVERVLPRDGWELPGVVTVGGMQALLKETGEAPRGPILLAGNGPLLMAVAAQLATAGNPPVAVLERGQPLAAALRHGAAAVNALRSWPHAAEALSYASRLLRARVPYCTGWAVVAIRATPAGLVVASRHLSGRYREYLVQHVALHDGLASNTTGLPAQDGATGSLVRAGDCREVLGAHAAVLDGRRAAQKVARQLGHCGQAQIEVELDLAMARLGRTQAALAQLFQAPSTMALVPTPNTVICRCEGLRRADFDQLQVAASAREVRLVGRFGMGACQGRFCAHSISALAHTSGIEFTPAALNGDVQRWPMRPVSLAALANYTDLDASSLPTVRVFSEVDTAYPETHLR